MHFLPVGLGLTPHFSPGPYLHSARGPLPVHSRALTRPDDDLDHIWRIRPHPMAVLPPLQARRLCIHTEHIRAMSAMTHGHARYDSPPTFTPTSPDHSVTYGNPVVRARPQRLSPPGTPFLRASRTSILGGLASASMRFALIIHVSGARASLACAAPHVRRELARRSTSMRAPSAPHEQRVADVYSTTFSRSPRSSLAPKRKPPPQTSARTTLLPDDASTMLYNIPQHPHTPPQPPRPSAQQRLSLSHAHSMMILPSQSPPAPASRAIRPRRAYNTYTAPTHLPASTTCAVAVAGDGSTAAATSNTYDDAFKDPGDASSRPAHIHRCVRTSPRFLSGESTPICAILRATFVSTPAIPHCRLFHRTRILLASGYVAPALHLPYPPTSYASPRSLYGRFLYFTCFVGNRSQFRSSIHGVPSSGFPTVFNE
ncbi:hypothetical protein B0H14DRAFT_3473237 [Mycena olivaceomarginata]|nr:hypothetical protein B0H14DRAFT_3473237 [Mycena olivaceomarginata]